jgi:tripartite-type tricarboxylate transporter receptor subunit TctC
VIIKVSRCLAAAILALALTAQARADDYPSRPIRLIVGFSAGSAGDVIARILATKMSPTLGQPIVVEDKPGASSNIALDTVARAPKDGYTLLLGTVANATYAAVTPDRKYDISKDFTSIGLAAAMPVLLVVTPSLGVHSVPELIANAKANPKKVMFASTGFATTPYFAGELLNTLAHIEMTHVPYQGSPPAMSDLLSGRVQVMFGSGSTVLPLVRSGKLVALASATAKRAAAAPDLPTMGELGMPQIDATLWFGIVAPAGTPADINKKLAAALKTALASEEVRDSFQKQGVETMSSTPKEFDTYLKLQVEKWTAVAKSAGVVK